MNLRAIKVLFREADTLALWGVPYEMREGQGPKDITDRRIGLSNGWLWLGSPGWWGGMDRIEQGRVQRWVWALGDAVPQHPNEWCSLRDWPRARWAHVPPPPGWCPHPARKGRHELYTSPDGPFCRACGAKL